MLKDYLESEYNVIQEGLPGRILGMLIVKDYIKMVKVLLKLYLDLGHLLII